MRTRGGLAVVAVVALATAGCSSDPDDGELDLGADDAAEATETAPPVEVTDEPSTPPSDEPLYPPLPPFEPDPSSGIPAEQQEEFAELYAEFLQVTLEATATVDDSDLPDVAAEDALAQQQAAVDQLREDGTYLDSRDIETRWVRVVEVENGPATVQECRIFGTESGVRSQDTDELLEPLAQPLARLFQARFELVEIEAETIGYRVVEFIAADGTAECAV